MFKSERRKEIYDNILYNFSVNVGNELLDVLPDCVKEMIANIDPEMDEDDYDELDCVVGGLCFMWIGNYNDIMWFLSASSTPEEAEELYDRNFDMFY